MAKVQQTRSNVFLRASREIEQVKRHGRRLSTSLFNLLVHRMEETPSRVGIVVGRRFGNAVRRNKVKRVFRELIRERHQDMLPGLAIVVFPKREALVQSFADLKQLWETTLRRSHLLRSRSA